MTPIYQTKFGEQGNCFAACVASLLDSEINNVPNWESLNEEWEVYVSRLNCYLREEHHLYFSYFEYSGEESDSFMKEDLKNSLYIVSGEASRGHEHAVIYKNGDLIHDPHPEGNGLLSLKHCYYFIKLFY